MAGRTGQRSNIPYRYNLAFAAILAGGFLTLSFLAIGLGITVGLDKAIVDAAGRFRNPVLAVSAYFFTSIGAGDFMIGAALAVSLILAWRAGILQGLAFGLGMLSVDILHRILKEVFARPRPELPWSIPSDGFAFPSGHSTISIFFFGYLAWLAATRLKPGPTRTTLLVLFPLIVLGVGWSRIYLGAHWPTDVLAGFAVGGAWLALALIPQIRISKAK